MASSSRPSPPPPSPSSPQLSQQQTNSSSASSVITPQPFPPGAVTPTQTPTLPPPSSIPSSTPPSSTSSSTPSSTSSQPTPPTPTSTPPNTDGSISSTPPLPPSTMVVSTPSTSVMMSTSVGMSDGQSFTTIVQMTTVVQQPATITNLATSSATAAGGGSSNTGAIVGGVVGGVGGLGLIAFIVWLILRQRRRAREEEFDGNFDPARVVPGHNSGLNLGDEGANITPYPYQPEMAQHRPSVDQHSEYTNLAAAGGAAVGGYYPYPTKGPLSPEAQPPVGPVGSWHGHSQPAYTSPTSDGGYTSSSQYPSPLSNSMSTAATTTGVGGAMGAYLGTGPSPGPSEVGSGSVSGSGHQGAYGAYPGSGRSAKEREGLGGRLVVSNIAGEGNQAGGPPPAVEFFHPQPYQNPYHGAGGPSLANSPPPHSVGGVAGEEKSDPGRSAAALTTGAGVRVHQDAGRVPDPEPEEIPPTYDSIPAYERR